MVRSVFVVSILLLCIIQYSTSSMSRVYKYAKPGDKVELEFFFETPVCVNRTVYNAKGVQQVHTYRVCNGKNKGKCGFWENVKNKQRVGPLTKFNKKRNVMIIPKVRALDAGSYYISSSGTIEILMPVKLSK